MHGLIFGQTMSGKTTLARRIARQHAAAGRGVLVLDPLFDEELRQIADWSTDDPLLFLKTAWKNQNCTLVIDEGGEAIGRYGTLLEKLATQARHLGHMSIFISQRPVQLPLTLRDQCAWLAAFKIRTRDAERLAEDFDDPAILCARSFDKGQYVITKPFGVAAVGHIFGGAPPRLGDVENENLSARRSGAPRSPEALQIDVHPAGGRSRRKNKPHRKS